MAKTGHYEVNINGIRHELQLTAEDAERIGATEVKAAPKAPANKAASAPEAKGAVGSGSATK